MDSAVDLLGQFITSNSQKVKTKKDQLVNYAQSFAIIIAALWLVKYMLSFFVKNPGTISWNFLGDDAADNSPLFSQSLFSIEQSIPPVVHTFEDDCESLSSGTEYIDPNNPRGDLDDQRVREIDCWIESVISANK